MWVLDDKILFSNANGEGCRVALTKTSNSGRTNACHLREVVGKDVGTWETWEKNRSPNGMSLEETRELFINPYLAESPAGARCCVAPKVCM